MCTLSVASEGIRKARAGGTRGGQPEIPVAGLQGSDRSAALLVAEGTADGASRTSLRTGVSRLTAATSNSNHPSTLLYELLGLFCVAHFNMVFITIRNVFNSRLFKLPTRPL